MHQSLFILFIFQGAAGPAGAQGPPVSIDQLTTSNTGTELMFITSKIFLYKISIEY